MSTVIIRPAEMSDLSAVEAIETRCFHASRRSSRRALRHSLTSPAQSVWLAVDGLNSTQQIAGALVLHHHRLSIRIYSLAVLPAFRGNGAGRRLVQKAVELAQASGRSSVTLEADRRNKVLTCWYEGFGFKTCRILRDYYSPGRHAVRMRLLLKPALKGGRVCGSS